MSFGRNEDLDSWLKSIGDREKAIWLLFKVVHPLRGVGCTIEECQKAFRQLASKSYIKLSQVTQEEVDYFGRLKMTDNMENPAENILMETDELDISLSDCSDKTESVVMERESKLATRLDETYSDWESFYESFKVLFSPHEQAGCSSTPVPTLDQETTKSAEDVSSNTLIEISKNNANVSSTRTNGQEQKHRSKGRARKTRNHQEKKQASTKTRSRTTNISMLQSTTLVIKTKCQTQKGAANARSKSLTTASIVKTLQLLNKTTFINAKSDEKVTPDKRKRPSTPSQVGSSSQNTELERTGIFLTNALTDDEVDTSYLYENNETPVKRIRPSESTDLFDLWGTPYKRSEHCTSSGGTCPNPKKSLTFDLETPSSSSELLVDGSALNSNCSSLKKRKSCNKQRKNSSAIKNQRKHSSAKAITPCRNKSRGPVKRRQSCQQQRSMITRSCSAKKKSLGKRKGHKKNLPNHPGSKEKVVPTVSTGEGRDIPTAADRVLDAEQIIDDYRLNLMDWNANNIVAVALGNAAYKWNATTGDVETVVELEGSNYVSSLSWIQGGGSLLAVATSNGFIQLWDTIESKRLRVMEAHSCRIAAMSWNSYILTSGAQDGRIMHHDVREKEHVVANLYGHELEVCGLKWSPDGEYLASGGCDQIVNIWAKYPGRMFTEPYPTHCLRGHRGPVKALDWNIWYPNLLATGGGEGDGQIMVWNCEVGTCLNVIDTQTSQVTGLLWSENYEEIVSSHGDPNNHLIIWQYPDLAKKAELKGHKAQVLNLALSPDGAKVLSASADKTIRLWRCFTIAPDSETGVITSRKFFKKIVREG